MKSSPFPHYFEQYATSPCGLTRVACTLQFFLADLRKKCKLENVCVKNPELCCRT